MLEALRDNAWSSIFAFVGIVVAVIIYFVSRSRKELTYEILAEIALLSVSKGIAEKVQILFAGIPVSNVHLVIIRFTNSGNVPITPSDFIERLNVKFGSDSKLLSFGVVDITPPSLSVVLEPISREGMEKLTYGFEVVPTLLNRGDSFTVQALISGYNGSPIVLGRIVGVKEIAPKVHIIKNTGLLNAIAAISFSLMLGGIFWALLAGAEGYYQVFFNVLVISALFWLVGRWATIQLEKFSPKKQKSKPQAILVDRIRRKE